MPPAPPPETDSTLCKRCTTALRFNDEALGGYEAQDEAGTPILRFRIGWVESGSGSGRKFQSGRRLKLDFACTDRLPHLPVLTAAAETCDFCRALRDATMLVVAPLVEPGDMEYKTMYMERNKLETGVMGIAKLCVVAEVRFDDEAAMGGVQHTFDFLIDARGDCRDWLQTLESPCDEALSLANIKWIKEELRVCVEEESCGPLPGPDVCPTRLIELWPEGGVSEEDSIRLVDYTTTRPAVTPRYAALSYCWGTAQDALTQLKTSANTLTQHMNGIPIKSMTPVVQDAIRVCRSLGIRHLWVDALCILQDDYGDWARESAQMGTIYTNALLTICTPAISSCRESFLSRAAPVRVRFESSLRPEIRGYLTLRHQPRRKPLRNYRTTFSSDMDVGAWRRRAWTFQEEYLSRRRLYFGASRMHLVSAHRLVSEPSLSRAQPTVDFHAALDEFRTLVDFERLYDMWIRVVGDYASRQLTYEEDKFPAIAGLARLVADVTGDEYMAGLWKGDLVRGLLWRECGQPERLVVLGQRSSPLSPSSRRYRYPSWSWAAGVKPDYELLTRSICGPNPTTREEEWELRSECMSITVRCVPEYSTSNPFGRISAAELQVEGKMIPAGGDWCHVGKVQVHNQWKCAVSQGCVATCELDWTVLDHEASHDDAHMLPLAKTLDVHDIHMLLLASTTGGDWKWESNHYTPIASAENSDDEDSDGDVDNSQKDADNSNGNVTGAIEKLQEPRNSKRNAWGLLLSPSKQSNKFIRVGRFKIWAKMGGLAAFAACEHELIQVI